MGTLARVFLVDDHPVVLFGLKLVLEQEDDFAVCGEARTVVTAREGIVKQRPDLVVLDLALGGRDGVEMVRDFASLHPGTRILVYSAQPAQTWARRVFQAGGYGYLGKSEGIENVTPVLRLLLAGERYAPDDIQRAIFQEFARGGTARSASDPTQVLSGRELQILCLLGEGLALSDIARTLCLSVKTIGTHRERMKEKLGVNNARALVRIAEDLRCAGPV